MGRATYTKYMDCAFVQIHCDTLISAPDVFFFQYIGLNINMNIGTLMICYAILMVFILIFICFAHFR